MLAPAMQCSCTEDGVQHMGQCHRMTRDGCDMCEQPICGSCNSGSALRPCPHGKQICCDEPGCDDTRDERRIVRCHACVKKYGRLAVSTVDTLDLFEGKQEWDREVAALRAERAS